MQRDRTEQSPFHGVYLLLSENEQRPGGTYIGYTVDPSRRIERHNKGRAFGGAAKTSSKGPWKMVLIVHGFPSPSAALQFEWTWQNPEKSRRLKMPNVKKRSAVNLAGRIQVMWRLIRCPPWVRMPLIVRWLCTHLASDPPAGLAAPIHMPIVFGTIDVNSKQKRKKAQSCPEIAEPCYICKGEDNGSLFLSCYFENCFCYYHALCLAKRFLAHETGNFLLPIEGTCPKCESNVLWGDLIRIKNGYAIT